MKVCMEYGEKKMNIWKYMELTDRPNKLIRAAERFPVTLFKKLEKYEKFKTDIEKNKEIRH